MPKKRSTDPAERAVQGMTPAQLRAAAERGNKLAQKILNDQRKRAEKATKKAVKKSNKALQKYNRQNRKTKS